jgi:hypothetical protein
MSVAMTRVHYELAERTLAFTTTINGRPGDRQFVTHEQRPGQVNRVLLDAYAPECGNIRVLLSGGWEPLMVNVMDKS